MQSKDDEAISFAVSFPTMNTKAKKKENLSVETLPIRDLIMLLLKEFQNY